MSKIMSMIRDAADDSKAAIDGAPSVGDTGKSSAKAAILGDYRLAYRSRQASLIGRTEVLTGKAKFGIFGDGKEVAQLAMAKVFAKGDFRAGYYRDQTFMMAMGELTLEQFFAQVYADPDPRREPASSGRQMNAHFATRMLDEDGSWLRLIERFNSAADLSPTASQMAKLVGLAYASKLYRELEGLRGLTNFSSDGNEIAFGTIGNASCAEGIFWEAINAVGVLGAPLLMSIWDDGYGISVPNDYQVTKGDLAAILSGFRRAKAEGSRGYEIVSVPGWDYLALCEAYEATAGTVRRDHVPAIVHVTELTQPQGHSTSGSHERYKSGERLAWEAEFDCNQRLRAWIVDNGLATEEELSAAETEDRQAVREAQRRAWEEYRRPIESERAVVVDLLSSLAREDAPVSAIHAALDRRQVAARRDIFAAAEEAIVETRDRPSDARSGLVAWRDEQLAVNIERYGSHLYSDTAGSALTVPIVEPVYADDAPRVNGSEVVNACFAAALENDPRVLAFGEDVGKLGDVNQGFAGLQAKFGELRVSDTGIREATILGQAIGLALRGLRPIAEIQYLDYLLYALQILSDDLATLRWRTRGAQKAPVIIRTRGHRLEGVWHSGSPMAGIVNLVRGVYVCVPRDMTRAAGFYNTLLRSDDPGLVIEVLNAYRAKERLPQNVGRFTVPLGVPEVLREGGDLTLVTYGACCKIALAAAETLAGLGVEVELIDVQTLLPFDREARIVESLKKTNRILFVDEDVPGGMTAFMMQKVLEEQGGYAWLDSAPRTLPAREHRPAYGSDGDYFSKPNRETIVRTVYAMLREAVPARFPDLGA